MANTNDKPSTSVQPNKNTQAASNEVFLQQLDQRLSKLQDKTHKFLACVHFCHESLRIVVAHHELPLPEPDHPWQEGLYWVNLWLDELGEEVDEEITQVHQWCRQQANALPYSNTTAKHSG